MKNNEEMNRINERFYRVHEAAVNMAQKRSGDKWRVTVGTDGEMLFDYDNVHSPSHYNTGKIEVIEFIEDQRLGYHLGNVVKYVCRAGRKDKTKTIEDLEKAAWYLARKIEKLKAKRDKRAAVRPNDMFKVNE